MTTRDPVTALGLAVFAFLVTGLSPAWAVETIVVTALRREEKLQDVPLAVTALQAEDIDKLQINLVKDIGQNVPNLQTYTITAGAEAIQVHARGASVQNPGFNASESPVGFYEDDVYRGRLASINLNLTDVERLEVLRGPQATLYGRNTIAGAIKIITRTPDDNGWANASIGYGNFDTVQLSGSMGGPIEKGALAGSFAVVYERRGEGWQFDPVTGENPGAYQNRAVRGKLHWYGSENLDGVLTAWGVRARNDGYNGVPYFPFSKGFAPPDALAPANSAPPPDGFYANYSPAGVNFGDTSQDGATLSWTYKLDGGLKLRSITGISSVRDHFGFDLAGGGFDFAGVGTAALGTPGLLVNSQASLVSWSQEFQLLGTAFGDRLDWIAGMFYLNESGNQDYAGSAAPFVDFVERTKTNTDSYAVFGEGTWHWTDRLSTTVGVRWSVDDKSYRNICGGAGGGSGTCFGSQVNLNRSFDEATPKVSVNYKFSDSLLGYLQYARGFQAGGFQTLCFGNLLSGPGGCAGNSYEPETVNSIELGAKSEFFERRLRVNAAVFDAMYSKLQETLIGPAGNFPMGNVGDVDVYGLELEVNWVPTDNLHLFANLGAMRNGNIRDRIGNAGCQDPPACTRFNDDLESLPSLSGKAGFDYTIGISDRLQFIYGADIYYTDSYYTEFRNLVKIPSFTRVNAFLGIQEPGGRWQVTLTGRNVTDREDNVSGLYAGGFTNIRTPLPPAEYMLTAKIRL